MARSAVPSKQSQLTLSDGQVAAQCQSLVRFFRGQRLFDRVPLVIVGAGVSCGKVPLLTDIGKWFHNELKDAPIACGYDWIKAHAESIGNGSASRRQAAEFFSAMQVRNGEFERIWGSFSGAFLGGPLKLPSGPTFDGIASATVKPTDAHRVLARFLSQRDAYVVSLNFDGLTHRSVLELCGQGTVLHSSHDIENYFCADTKSSVPAVVKIRGDVFYARCKTPTCGLSVIPYPIDRLRPQATPGLPLHCPNCSGTGLLLQFEFPGYRSKEELAYSMLDSLRGFLKSRVSGLIIVGFSGRWDRYMLEFLFNLAVAQRIPVIDVKPPDASSDLIKRFCQLYYPSIRSVDSHQLSAAPTFLRVHTDADTFFTRLQEAWYE